MKDLYRWGPFPVGGKEVSYSVFYYLPLGLVRTLDPPEKDNVKFKQRDRAGGKENPSDNSREQLANTGRCF